MVSSRVTIKNPTGLHLRPAGQLCKTAIAFQSKITIRFGNTTANAKSVLGVLGACIKSGDEIELICEGQDEEEALKALTKAIESGLGEELPDI
ncbi:MAG: Phosphocarrier protein HPr [Lachnoclostridium sp.]|jgi:phosphocarrier protein HPr